MNKNVDEALSQAQALLDSLNAKKNKDQDRFDKLNA